MFVKESLENWLFLGCPIGTTACASIYTLVGTARINGLDLMKYITFILCDCPGTGYISY